MHLLAFLALFALSSDANAARILGLFPHTGKSHHMVFEPLLKKLAERGHSLTVASFFPLENPPANYTDISLQSTDVNLGIETIHLGFYEEINPLLKKLGVYKFLKPVFEMSPLADMAVNVCKNLVDWPPLVAALKQEYDLVLVENFNSDCMLGMLDVFEVKAPVVALLSCGLMPWSAERVGATDNPAYVPVITHPFTSKMSFGERLENTIFKIYFALWYRHAIQAREQAVLEARYGRVRDLGELARNTSLVLVNSAPALHGARPLVPGIVEVGGMHLNPVRKTIPDYMERFLNESEHGVIIFSFGSLIRTSSMPQYKEDMIVRALSKLKQRVIWKYEESGEQGNLTGNILRVRWLPQYELIQHPKVVAFLAHGGLLGMTEAISAGKPMLVVPFYGDQPLNGAAATRAGFAKMVSYEDITEEALTEALQSVLSAEMRLNARRASQIWWDRENAPLDTAVYWVERVARWGDQSPLYSNSRDLSFIEYALIDVSLVLIAACLILIMAVKFLVTVFFRLLIGGSNKKEKLH